MHWNGDWQMGWMGLWWILIVPVLIAVVWFALSAARRRGDMKGMCPMMSMHDEVAEPPPASSGDHESHHPKGTTELFVRLCRNSLWSDHQ